MSSVVSFSHRSATLVPSENGSGFRHKIQHPASRLSAPDSISIAGTIPGNTNFQYHV